MQTQIPKNTNKAMRTVVLRHPNATDVVVFRRKLLRTDPGGAMGGLPKLGGMGVLEQEDEDNYEVQELGACRMLPCEAFQPSDMVDRDDAINAAEGVLSYALIEPMAAEGEAAHFEIKSRDLVFLVVWEGVYVGYEVVGRETNINIPPFARRYALAKRDDLKFLGNLPGQ